MSKRNFLRGIYRVGDKLAFQTSGFNWDLQRLRWVEMSDVWQDAEVYSVSYWWIDVICEMGMFRLTNDTTIRKTNENLPV
jgi:hypothetical protein